MQALRRKLIYIRGIGNWTKTIPVRRHDGGVHRPGEEGIVLCPVGQRKKPAHLSLARQIESGPKTNRVRIIIWRQVALPTNLLESIRCATRWCRRIQWIRKTSLFVGDAK